MSESWHAEWVEVGVVKDHIDRGWREARPTSALVLEEVKLRTPCLGREGQIPTTLGIKILGQELG